MFQNSAKKISPEIVPKKDARSCCVAYFRMHCIYVILVPRVDRAACLSYSVGPVHEGLVALNTHDLIG